MRLTGRKYWPVHFLAIATHACMPNTLPNRLQNIPITAKCVADATKGPTNDDLCPLLWKECVTAFHLRVPRLWLVNLSVRKHARRSKYIDEFDTSLASFRGQRISSPYPRLGHGEYPNSTLLPPGCARYSPTLKCEQRNLLFISSKFAYGSYLTRAVGQNHSSPRRTPVRLVIEPFSPPWERMNMGWRFP